MRISLKTEYALRAILELAKTEKDKPLSIREICDKQKLPFKFIEQLFRQLKQQNLIKSLQGSKGGYLLNGELDEINLNHIMKALDDDYKATPCNHDQKYCSGIDCTISHVMVKIQEDMEKYFNEFTLEKIINKKGVL